MVVPDFLFFTLYHLQRLIYFHRPLPSIYDPVEPEENEERNPNNESNQSPANRLGKHEKNRSSYLPIVEMPSDTEGSRRRCVRRQR